MDLTLPDGSSKSLTIVTGSSDGAIRLWRIDKADFSKARLPLKSNPTSNSSNTVWNDASADSRNQFGQLIGTYETGNRITCLKAFIMSNPVAADEAQPNSELKDDDLDVVDSESSASL